jgi:hypothetical protein
MPETFPERYAALEPYADWVIPSMRGRVRKRVSSSLAEARSLYEAVAPRLEEILTYLDQFKMDQLPEREMRLLDLTLALAEIATCVEFYNSMSVPKGVEHDRLPLVEPTDVW